MSDPNDFVDNLVRESASSSFQYENKYWKEMESMLDAQDTAAKQRKIFVWTSICSVIAVFGMMTFVLLEGDYQNYKPNQQNIALHSNFEMNMSSVQNLSSVNQSTPNKLNNSGLSASVLKDPTKKQVNQQQASKSGNQKVAISKSKENFDGNPNSYVSSGKSIELASIQNTNIINKLPISSPDQLGTTYEKEISNIENSIDFSDLSTDRPNKHHLDLAAGLNIGMLMPSGYSGVDYFASVGYTYDFTPQWSFSSGIQYTKKSINRKKTKKFNNYSFDRREDRLEINYNNIHYLQMPMSVNFNINKHTLSAVVTPSYALGIESSQKHTRKLPDYNKFNTVDKIDRTYGTSEGINRWDVNVGLSYAYQINDFMQLGGRASVGTIDVTNNDYWGEQAKVLNVDAKLYLNFRIL